MRPLADALVEIGLKTSLTGLMTLAIHDPEMINRHGAVESRVLAKPVWSKLSEPALYAPWKT